MVKGTRFTILAACASLVWCVAAATAAEDMSQRNSATPAPAESAAPMKMDEPMQGGMMKKGMTKGDVKESSDKKKKEMREMLEKEEKSMPPMPPETPQSPRTPPG